MGNASVAQILVGLNRVGIAGLRAAFDAVDASGVRDREGVVDLMMRSLQAQNYIPESQLDLYRTAFWREYLRHRGQPFSDWYSEFPVTVTGPAGEERGRFVAQLQSLLAKMELRPAVTFEAPDLPQIELRVHGETLARSTDSRTKLEGTISRLFSDW